MVAGWILGMTLAASASPGDRAVEVATAVVSRRPRTADSPAVEATWDLLQHELEGAGWPVARLHGPGRGDDTLLACRRGARDGVLLLLAHVDAVHPEVPGANDNAAAVGVLVLVAEALPAVPPRTVCLGFPDGEEVGLRGSRILAERLDDWCPGPLEQVVSLDLVGRGRPTHHGWGPGLGAPTMAYLLEAFPAEVPWVYRAVSVMWPEGERSDHRPFARGGHLATLVLARPPGGFDAAYHTRSDTPDRLEPATMGAVAEGLVRLAHASPPPRDEGSSWAFVVPWLGAVVPGGLSVGLLGLSGLATVWGLVDRWRRADPAPTLRGGLRRTGLGASVALVALALAGGGLVPAGALAGAWGLGTLALVLATAPWLARDPGPVPLGVAAGVGLVAAGGLVAADATLLAWPWVVAWAGAAWAHRAPVPGLVVASWPALYLLRGDAWQELVHYGLFPDSSLAWAPLLLAALPVSSALWSRPRPPARSTRRAVAGLLGGLLVLGLLGLCAERPGPGPMGERLPPTW